MKVQVKQWNGVRYITIARGNRPICVQQDVVSSPNDLTGKVLALNIHTLKVDRVPSAVFHAEKGINYLAASSKAARELRQAA